MMWPRDRPGDIATAHPVSSCDDAQLRRTIAAPRLGLTHRPGARPGLVRRTEEGQPRYGAPRVDHLLATTSGPEHQDTPDGGTMPPRVHGPVERSWASRKSWWR